MAEFSAWQEFVEITNRQMAAECHHVLVVQTKYVTAGQNFTVWLKTHKDDESERAQPKPRKLMTHAVSAHHHHEPIASAQRQTAAVPSRRRVLRRAIQLSGFVLASGPLASGFSHKTAAAAPAERRLQLHHFELGEALDVTYCRGGQYDRDALASINYLLRDWHQDEVHPIDPILLDMLVTIQHRLQFDGPFEIMCGYRTKATNDRLRRQGKSAARKSYHLVGRAIDLYVPTIRLRHLRKAAASLRVGGVGYYPRAGFIHVDSGPVRYW